MKEILLTLQAVSDRCANCPELDIQIDRYEIGDITHNFNKNICQCRHLHRCERLYSQMKEDWEENHVRQI